MDNNDILRRLRFTLSLNDNKMIELFTFGNLKADRTKVSDWLKRDGDEAFVEMSDKELASFFNGLIIAKRGKQEGREPIAEDELSNNLILKKLKIALKLTSEDIVEAFKLIDKKITVSEIGAFLRKPDHHKYKEFNGQYLRNLLNGLQAKYTQRDNK
ncbi:DUF1456 family protein [Carboxylicivirga sp. M1479]|uniref:DUF1456 family protein n=1 Tax=Carboxylicivirga sp. M1479 TaxID=2594476 RepID=UPI001177D378|nr:DUF1456 family protein [Carboxylicivirga sp. M1479]TRX66329.1 DUF1456 family protein [Carboxylicivirga sp. M1479]